MDRAPGEIIEQVELARESMETVGTQWSGMSFEEGVIAALEWATGLSDEPPMAGAETKRAIRDAKRKRLTAGRRTPGV